MLLPHRGLKEIHSGRDFERFVNFSDAVVAVAITVLVLAIVDIRPHEDESTVWEIIGDNAGQIFTFFFTFLVVGIMWLAHNRVVNQLRGFDGTIFWVNLLWLAGIAFLPWPSSLYGESFAWGASESAHGGGTGALYWGTLAVVSALAFFISWHARHTPELLEPSARQALDRLGSDRGQYRGLVFAALFLVIGLVSVYSQSIAGYMAFLIIPASILVRTPSPSDDFVEDANS